MFCGGGIGAYGVKKAGFNIIYALDNDINAAKTYNKNINNCCVCKDIRKVDINSIPNSDIILGSPVCKPFSFAGKHKGFNDSLYGDLISYYIQIISIKRPKAFVFENVPGILSPKHKDTFLNFLYVLEKEGYKIQYRIINAAEYGVAQIRKRVIVVGTRNDIINNFIYPIPLKINKTIFDVISDLPKPSLTSNSNEDIQFSGIEKAKNHYGYGIRKDELKYVDKIPSGGNWKNLNCDDAKEFLGSAYYSGGGKTGFLRKVDIHKQAHTITSMMNGKNNAQIISNKDLYKNDAYGMPSCRRFTVRECLRLQSVGDDYILDEDISVPKQYEIVGNGIPSSLLYYIFIELKKLLSNDLNN